MWCPILSESTPPQAVGERAHPRNRNIVPHKITASRAARVRKCAGFCGGRAIYPFSRPICGGNVGVERPGPRLVSLLPQGVRFRRTLPWRIFVTRTRSSSAGRQGAALSPEGLTTWLREMLRRTNIKKGYVRPPLKIKIGTQVHLVNPKTGKVLGLTKIRPPRRRGYWELVKGMGPRKRKKLFGR
jgi:hypothetical protein